MTAKAVHTCRLFVRKNRKGETMIEIITSPIIAVLFFTLIKKEKKAVISTIFMASLQMILFFRIGALVFFSTFLMVLNAGGTKPLEGRKELFEMDGNTELALHTGLSAYCTAFLYVLCNSDKMAGIFMLVSCMADRFLMTGHKATARRCILCLLFLASLTISKLLEVIPQGF